MAEPDHQLQIRKRAGAHMFSELGSFLFLFARSDFVQTELISSQAAYKPEETDDVPCRRGATGKIHPTRKKLETPLDAARAGP
ncbi:MAG: hypothetical protein AB3N22_21260 [Ruegeria sp.]